MANIIVDDNLKIAINKELNRPSPYNQDVTIDDLSNSSFNQLYTQWYDVEDEYKIKVLDGLEYAKSLKILYLAYNKINNINVIENFPELNNFSIWKNKVEDISVIDKLTKLDSLDIGSNKISDVSVLGKYINNKLSIVYLDNQSINIKRVAVLNEDFILDLNFLKDVDGNIPKTINSISNGGVLSEDGKYIIWKSWDYSISLAFDFMGSYKLYTFQGSEFSGRVSIDLVENVVLDENLRIGINKALGKSSFYTQGISKEELENPSFTQLYFAGEGLHEDKKIKDLTGLDYAINIERLLLKYHKIEDINSLKNLNKLRYLNLMFNSIKNIDSLKYVNDLGQLYIQGNNISDMTPLSGYLNNLIQGPISYEALLNDQKISIEDIGVEGEDFVLDLSFLKDVDGNIPAIIESKDGGLRQGNLVVWKNLNYPTRITLDFQGNVNITMTASMGYFSGIVTIDIKKNVVPDENLRIAINKRLGRYPYEQGILEEHLLELNLLNATNKNIKSLEGLQFAENLTYLKIAENEITDLSPISGLPQIITLNMKNNMVSDISPISNLTTLRKLYITSNTDIKDISSLNRLTNLTELYIDNTGINNIDVLENFINLKYLNFSQNSITNLSPISEFTNLIELYGQYNMISDISYIKNLENLEILNLNNNNIVNLNSISNLSKLKILSLNENQISNLSKLTNLINLKELFLYNNKISDVSPLSKLTNLEELYINNNHITSIYPISNLNLTALNAQNQTINFKNVYENDNTFTMNLKFLKDRNNLTPNIINTVGEYNSKNNTITFKNINSPQTISFEFSNENDFSGVVEVDLFEQNKAINNIDENVKIIINQTLKRPKTYNKPITTKDIISLISLDMKASNISDISYLKYAINLKKLSLPLNKIEDLSPLEELINLEYLDLSFNNINDITYLRKLINLRLLYIFNNNIEQVNSLSNLVDLLYLDISNNQITNFTPIQDIVNKLWYYKY